MKCSQPLFWILIVLVQACSFKNEEERLVTPNGLEYQFHRSISNEKAQIGDILVIDMQYGTADSVIFDSKNYGRPVYLQVTNPAYSGSMEEGLVLLGAGDSATFYLSADSVYNRIFNQPLPPGIMPGSELVFHIGVIAVRNEDRDLEKFLLNQGITDTARYSGLIISRKVEGKGKTAVSGKKVTVHYTGSLLDGTKFDSSRDRNEPFTFVLGEGQVIQGWEEGIALLREGDVARLIIPSYLAYGPKGAAGGVIPPYATLLFDVEVLKVE
jgi:FKBP-type peptidyl-prolyl cis-trans isomerase FkpA